MPKLDEVAREMFRLRSLKEHLSEWPSELGYIKEPDRDGFVSLRAFQAEVLAGEAYHRVLADPSLSWLQFGGRYSGLLEWPRRRLGNQD